jgi:hypothetical protein
MTDELRALYSAPFVVDKYGIYIHDSAHHVVADFTEEKTFRPRGWGRFQKMQDGERLHDEMANLLRTIVGQETDPLKAVALLDAAWEKK